MILSAKENALTYRCPICGAHVISMVGVFGLSGDLIKLKCTCGGSVLTIQREKGDKLALSVPCLFCEEEHQYTVDRRMMFTNRALTLTCQLTGLEVMCVGDEESVKEYCRIQDEKLDDILKQIGYESLEQYLTGAAQNRLNRAAYEEDGYEDDYEDDEEDEVLVDQAEVIAAVDFILAELEEEGHLRCACKEGEERDLAYCYQDGILQIFCRSCGSETEIQIRTGADLHAFYEIDAIRLEKIAVIDFDTIPDASPREDE